MMMNTSGKILLLKQCSWLPSSKIVTNFWCSRSDCGTHYETLGLNETCTQSDVKKAYIEKSKRFHPDKKPQGSDNHCLFVALNDAYSVLGKYESRRLYDQELAFERQQNIRNVYYYSNDVMTNAPRERVILRDDDLWETRDKSQDYKFKDTPYYGIKGVKRVSNGVVAAGVVAFMIIGAIFHYFIAKISSKYSVGKLDKSSQQASQAYMEVREKARVNGLEKQMELLLQRSELSKKQQASSCK